MSNDGSIETLLTGLISIVAWATASVWLGAAAAMTLTHGTGITYPTFGEALIAATRYLQTPQDLSGIWPLSTPTLLLWTCTAVAALGLGFAAHLLFRFVTGKRIGFTKRKRLGSAPEAHLATKPELSPLFAKTGTPGRFVFGRFQRQLLASENRTNPGVRQSRRTRKRATDRGAVAVIGPSRMGKSIGLISGVLDWEGPAVLMSVKDDLIGPTLPHRRRQGECAVFDPTQELTDAYRIRHQNSQTVPAWDERLLVSWSPLRDVATFDAAQKAARALVEAAPKTGGEGSDFWMDQAQMLLSGLLFAAGNSAEHSMASVYQWVISKDQPTPQGSGAVYPLLARLASGFGTTPAERVTAHNATQALEVLQGIWGDEERTVSSVYATARAVVWPWSTDHVARAAIGESVSLEWLIKGTNTLYLSSPPQSQARLSAVFGGLLNDLLEQCFIHALAHGPIEPPLLVLIDEAGNTPLRRLPEFVATVAGLGVQLVTSWQDLAQVQAGYGKKADTVINNHLSKIGYPGQSDDATLKYLSGLIGEEAVQTVSQSSDNYALFKGQAQISEQRVPLGPPHVLRQMEKHHAVLIHAALPPAYIDAIPFFEERRYKRRLKWRAGPRTPGRATRTFNRITKRLPLIDLIAVRPSETPTWLMIRNAFRTVRGTETADTGLHTLSRSGCPVPADVDVNTGQAHPYEAVDLDETETEPVHQIRLDDNARPAGPPPVSPLAVALHWDKQP